ncbi:MAG: hypothetical protein IKK37_05955 [Clostridia bacterium]|nr:hypothetical protein [Clostridia bacterium]
MEYLETIFNYIVELIGDFDFTEIISNFVDAVELIIFSKKASIFYIPPVNKKVGLQGVIRQKYKFIPLKTVLKTLSFCLRD